MRASCERSAIELQPIKACSSAAQSVHSVSGQEKGQTLIEFALVLMILLLLTFGMIDLSRAVYTASVLQAAAQAGARAGMISPDLDEVKTAVQARLVGLDSARVLVTRTMLTSERVEVTVTYDLILMTPLIAQLAPDGRITLRASASMLTR
jgi:Flp pilus assembly protein TadG